MLSETVVVAALVVICSIVFMASYGSYLSVLVGLETMLFAAVPRPSGELARWLCAFLRQDCPLPK